MWWLCISTLKTWRATFQLTGIVGQPLLGCLGFAAAVVTCWTAHSFADEQCGVLAEEKEKAEGRRELGKLPDPISMTDNLFRLMTKQVRV